MAVTPWLAADAATADMLLLKKPVNHGTLVPVRTKVATVSPGAIANTRPTTSMRPPATPVGPCAAAGLASGRSGPLAAAVSDRHTNAGTTANERQSGLVIYFSTCSENHKPCQGDRQAKVASLQQLPCTSGHPRGG